MCGFVGWVDFRRDLRQDDAVLRAMTDTMRDRGPDAQGEWSCENAALGHRRLSVIDLSGGQQPMTADTPGGTVALCYAGEVYNFVRLREQLEAGGASFRTRSDTEVVLQAYLAWGGRFVERLNGMFAFAIWDGRSRNLLLGRDRLGVKPLYYHRYASGLLFASEPKGIMANPLFEVRLDFDAIPILFQPRLSLPGETPLRGLAELCPGTTLTLSPSGVTTRRYWELTNAPHTAGYEETAETIRDLLGEIVADQLQADVPVASMLSGGLDSTAVSALAQAERRRSGDVLATYCLDFETDARHFKPTDLRPEIDGPYAASAARALATRHINVRATSGDVDAAIPACRKARDLPSWGQLDASLHVLFRAIRKDHVVALSGEAADEIFGGYPLYFDAQLIERDTFPWLRVGPQLSDCLASDVCRRLDPKGDVERRYADLLSRVPRTRGEAPHEARMREVQFLNMCGPFSVILDRKDRISMGVGLEVRVPFCDHRLVEYMWNVPWALKSRGGPKGLLKRAMRADVPVSTLQRKKSAYPSLHDPGYERVFLDEAIKLVSDPRSPISSLFDSPKLLSLIDQIRTNVAWTNAWHMLIPIVEASHWIDDYGVSLR